MFDFSEMLPVGMVAHGGQVAQIMADIAKRQRGLPDWEAFHYERISDQAVELTGGIVSTASGAKRWLEPHDCVTIPLAAVVLEMQKLGIIPASNAPSNSAIDAVSLVAATHQNRKREVMHVSFALPSDAIGRQRLLKTFHLRADFFGAEVIACSLEPTDITD
ncbi:hypothetical protein H8K35_11265 [Undibacterium sp. LX40W]|uniref:Uncharacterized protein n=1 Tax=Undibacterium nitidum TaxID=2762298 RepID=A0A923KT01_9BURK|nr:MULTISPECIES: hypothetical protein [Undibacterium]MBC3881761.1 hypothetical protein [Undibacterium nitidum]MBC3892242.1 hypothetical protein [Undibacterium sp. LX40W]